MYLEMIVLNDNLNLKLLDNLMSKKILEWV